MDEKISFEAAMKRLDEIVASLERGDIELEKALALFEEGTALIRRSTALLENAEQKVLTLSRREDGSVGLKPFEEASDVD